MAFTGLCLSELLRAFTARSEHYSIFSIGFFSNRWMVWAVGFSFLLVMMTVYVPFLQPFFGTQPLTFLDWVEMIPFILMAPVAAELVKIYLRRSASKIVPAVAA
jgi:Ca2+-transporting ATPase